MLLYLNELVREPYYNSTGVWHCNFLFIASWANFHVSCLFLSPGWTGVSSAAGSGPLGSGRTGLFSISAPLYLLLWSTSERGSQLAQRVAGRNQYPSSPG